MRTIEAILYLEKLGEKIKNAATSSERYDLRMHEVYVEEGLRIVTRSHRFDGCVNVQNLFIECLETTNKTVGQCLLHLAQTCGIG